MSKAASSSFLLSRRAQLAIVVLIFAALVALRHLVGAFAFSLGYLYVAVVSLSGFWFGIRGGLIAAASASVIFVAELFLFQDLLARDIALNSIYLRLFVYFIAGIFLGYLSQVSQKRMATIEKLSEQKSIFVGMAAHDLRNPLASITFISNALLYNIDKEPPTAHGTKLTLERISEASERMLALINDILDITAVETGRIGLKKDMFSYIQLVRRNAECNKIIAQQEDIDIIVNIESEVPDVFIDVAKIDQVLNNIVGNAIKFAPAASTVTITVATVDGEITTSVADKGPGIEPQDVPHIFDAFYRAEHKSEKKAEQKSTGLGLAIAKSIIEAHGGRIWAESSPDAGTVVAFGLPVEGQKPEDQ